MLHSINNRSHSGRLKYMHITIFRKQFGSFWLLFWPLFPVSKKKSHTKSCNNNVVKGGHTQML